MNRDPSAVRRYYEASDRELAQRYIQDEPFLSSEYCRRALEHRYSLYPWLRAFASFDEWRGRDVLEIGCGQGADLSQFAAAGARAFGCDLTRKHCEVSRTFVEVTGSRAHVTQADARMLPYPSDSFDLVYSFGVLLLIEELDRAIAEIHRVLKPGGTVMVMFYNRQSLHYYVKTLYYYGVVCDLGEILGPRRLVDWFTDGFGYPRTYHQTPDSLRQAFDRFTIESLTVRNLTPDQLPLVRFEDYPPEFWTWVESRLGFYLLLRAQQVTTGLTTWDSLPPAGGPVLLVVNAAVDEVEPARAAFEALATWAGRDAIRAVAPAAWKPWLEAQGVRDDDVLLSRDEQGREIELLHYLQTSVALPWIVERQVTAVVGVQPHSLYNDRIQEEFERQLCLLLGPGCLLAHTLPHQYVYVFDVPALVRRFGRARRVQDYADLVHRLVDDLLGVWEGAGREPADNGSDFRVVVAALERHLDSRLNSYDEAAPMMKEVPRPDSLEHAVARWIDSLRAALLDRDTRVTTLTKGIAERDEILVELQRERNHAVALRDGIIEELRAELDVVPRLLRRLLSGRRTHSQARSSLSE